MQSKREWINGFIEEDILPAILYFGVIDTMLESLEEYINFIKRAIDKNQALTISHDYANRAHYIDYLPRDFHVQNKPIKIIKIYIKALNISLNKLRGYKIILNNEKVTIHHAYPTNNNGERTENHNLYRCNILSNERAYY